MIFSNALFLRSLKFSFLSLPMFAFLAGCTEKANYDFPPACPKVSVLPSASDAYTFENNQENLSHLITKASIISISGNCADDPNNDDKDKKKRRQDKIDLTMNITIQVQRGPASQQRHYHIPYFIATLRNGEIVDKKEFSADIEFPNNIDQLTLKSRKLLFKMPATPARTPDGYEYAIGFQLSQEQLAYNRTHFRNASYTSY